MHKRILCDFSLLSITTLRRLPENTSEHLKNYRFRISDLKISTQIGVEQNDQAVLVPSSPRFLQLNVIARPQNHLPGLRVQLLGLRIRFGDRRMNIIHCD